MKTARIDATGWHDSCEGPGCREGKYINWLTINDQAESVLEDVARIKSHLMVAADIPVCGFIYDVKSECLLEVPVATEAGRAS